MKLPCAQIGALQSAVAWYAVRGVGCPQPRTECVCCNRPGAKLQGTDSGTKLAACHPQQAATVSHRLIGNFHLFFSFCEAACMIPGIWLCDYSKPIPRAVFCSTTPRYCRLLR